VDEQGEEQRNGQRFLPGSGTRAAAPESADIASSAKATSRADWKRSSRRFSRQRLTMRSRTGWTAPLALVNSGGSSFRIAVIVSAHVLAWNALRPQTIS
jgi:hypothetical protein